MEKYSVSSALFSSPTWPAPQHQELTLMELASLQASVRLRAALFKETALPALVSVVCSRCQLPERQSPRIAPTS